MRYWSSLNIQQDDEILAKLKDCTEINTAVQTLKDRYGSSLVIKDKLYGRLLHLQSEDTKDYVDAKKTLNNLTLRIVILTLFYVCVK